MNERPVNHLTSEQWKFLHENSLEDLQKKRFEEFPSYPLVRERIERECLIRSVVELNKFLARIEANEGRLPGVILFPDTSTRPFAYLIKPLLKQMYEARHLPLPKQAFVATHRFDDTNQYFAREGRQLQITVDNTNLHTFYNLRDQRIRDFKRLPKHTSQTDLDHASQEIEAIGNRINQIKLQKAQAFDDLAWLEQKGWKALVSARIQEAVQQAPDQPILLIDDFLSAGDTLRAFTDTHAAYFSELPLYFFSFLAFVSPTRPDPALIPHSHYANGVNLYANGLSSNGPPLDFLETNPPIPPDFFTNPEVFANEEPRLCRWAAWRSISFEGISKERHRLGYEKSPFSRSKYASLKLPQDSQAMHELRDRFTAIGQNALRFLK